MLAQQVNKRLSLPQQFRMLANISAYFPNGNVKPDARACSLDVVCFVSAIVFTSCIIYVVFLGFPPARE